MRINQSSILHLDYYYPPTPDDMPSFILMSHPETNTVVLQEWSEGALDDNRLQYLLPKLGRMYRDDVIFLRHNKNDNSFDRIYFKLTVAKGMQPASYAHTIYDVSNIKVEFYSKDLKSHEILYGSKE